MTAADFLRGKYRSQQQSARLLRIRLQDGGFAEVRAAQRRYREVTRSAK